MDDLSSEDKATGVKTRPEEETTARHIRRGTVIEVRASDAGPSMIALDAERTPVVLTPSVPPGYSNRPPPPWSMDLDDMTTRQWSPSLAPPPLPSPMPPRGSRIGRLADLVGLQTVAALALLVIAGLHFSERREAASQGMTTPGAAAAAAPVGAADVPPPVEEAEPVDEPTPTAQTIEIAPITDLDLEFPAGEAEKAVAPEKRIAAVDLLTVGHEALRRGRFDQARAAYAGLMVREPRNVEAIAGLADVARARGEISYAAELYNRAVEAVPTYLPAQIGLADALWDTGDRSRSVARYHAIVEGFAHVPRYVEVRAQSGMTPERKP